MAGFLLVSTMEKVFPYRDDSNIELDGLVLPKLGPFSRLKFKRLRRACIPLICRRNPGRSRLIIAATVLIIVIFFTATCDPCLFDPSYQERLPCETLLITKHRIFSVAFFGDSLIRNPPRGYNMLGKIEMLIPDFNLNLMDFGVGGDKISDMLHRIDDVLLIHADAMILLWDSDISDIDERQMSPYEVRELRAKYASNISSVINKIKLNSPNVLLAMGGLI
jgi:hypothetical protein